jgi:transcriptional regulator with XRE-family HTH domain
MAPQGGMPRFPTVRSKAALVFEARRTLGISREELGTLLGMSKRTVGRWETGQSMVHAQDLLELARHVHPHDAALAEELGISGGATLQSLGIVSLPSPAPLPAIPAHLLVDAIVCAAADALKAVPETVRASVLAAFRRARELHMTIEDVESALTNAGAEPPAARPPRKREVHE